MVAALSSLALGTALVAYTVKPGDTLWKISQTTRVPMATILQDNQISQPNSLSIGQTIQLPASTGASTAAVTTSVSQPATVHSIVDLQRYLADLGYLPMNDSLQWLYPNLPPSLRILWQPGANNVMTRGAVMQFQADNGLVTDGIAGVKTWSSLEAAMNNHIQNPHGYSYVYVSETAPFTIYVWHDGNYVLSTSVNLGIDQSPTTSGTFPVYLQYATQEMKGTNPDGSVYDDPGVPYVSYFYHGEAIHGFTRSSYGSKQSLGCVELPYAAAAAAWNYIHIGTLVTIDQ